MHADIGYPLAADYVRAAPISSLLGGIAGWLKREKPSCLRHPLGFYVVLLGRSETEEWRFHYWPKGPRALTGMPATIHTHDRHVESRILLGELTNIIYDPSQKLTPDYPVYEVRYEGDRHISNTVNILQRTSERIGVLEIRRDTRRCGDVYQVEPHTYHQALVPESTVAATIVCMSHTTPGEVFVLGIDGYPETIRFTREHQDSSVFSQLL